MNIKIENKRIIGVDLVKFVACIMVVVLHVFDAGGGGYLLGACAIPLFFMANGFFLYDRELSWDYCSEKVKKYILFFLKWTILFIPIESLKNGQLTITPVQAFMGRGLMFHLWFLPALCIGLIAFCVVNSMMKKSRLQVFVTLDGTIGIAILMSFIYLLFLYTNLEIKSITVPPLRVVTSCGYMYFGMAMRKYGTETNIGCINRGTFYRLLIVCYFWICYTVFKTDMIWASSHYNSPMVIVGCFSIFGICLMVKHIPHILNFLLPCTTGIWILHPFAIRVLNKIYRILGMEVSIETKFLNLVFCPVICMVVTCILSKNKWLKRFFTV